MDFACSLSESGVNGQEWISAMHEVKNITTTPEVLKLIADIDEFKGLSGEIRFPSASSGQVLAELSARLGMTFFPGAYKLARSGQNGTDWAR